jgi:hypothetical protein
MSCIGRILTAPATGCHAAMLGGLPPVMSGRLARDLESHALFDIGWFNGFLS